MIFAGLLIAGLAIIILYVANLIATILIGSEDDD